MRRALAIAVALLAALPAVAGAALPTPGLQLQGHDHVTRGGNWHVQLLVSKKDVRVIDTLVYYAEVCGETILRTRIPIAESGLFSGHGTIKGGGRWRVDGIFLAADTVLGTARMVKGRCDTGAVPFAALTDRAHQHLTTPVFPDIASASLTELRQAQAMRRRAWQASVELFPTYRSALEQGYRASPNLKWRPMLFHLRNPGYEHDGVTFSSRKPEALVYWFTPGIDPMLMGLMFRVPKGKRPAYAGPIPIYHNHFGTTTSAPMTHVWLTNDLRSAWMNCAPIASLAAAHPGFVYAGAQPLTHGPGTPCPG